MLSSLWVPEDVVIRVPPCALWKRRPHLLQCLILFRGQVALRTKAATLIRSDQQ